MKQVFYKGLLALTIAFGVTSCDKNDVGELNEPMTAVKGITSKVSFGESTGIKVKNEAGKTASEFDHIYSPVAQSIDIMDSAGAIVFSGSYAAGDIASGITSDDGSTGSIILQNGSYSVVTTNEGGEGIGYLPYSSTADFVLNSNTGTIDLIVAHTHGFVIINVEDAIENGRVTGATASLGGENPVSLLTDVEFGDFYGYLVGGMNYDITANYDLNGVSTPRSDLDKRIAIGLAYTFELGLTADTPAVVGSMVSTSTIAGLESELVGGAGNDINSDGDLLDTLTRILTTTTPTLNDEVSGPGVVTESAWSLDVDNDIDVDVQNEESTEVAIDININNDDGGELYDTVTRVVTTTTESADGVDGDVAIDEGDWTILGDYSSAGFGETPGTGNGDVADVDGDGFGADVDLNDNDDTIGDQAAEDAKAQAAQDELDRIAQEAADAQAEIDRLAAEQAAADAAALAAQVEADRVAAEEAAAAALLAAAPDTLSAWSAYSGTNPGFGDADTREENASTEQGAPTSQEFLTETYDLVTFMAGYTYQETRTRIVVQNGDLDAEAPEGALSESQDVVIAENIVSTESMTREIDNDAYVAPSASFSGSGSYVSTVGAPFGTPTVTGPGTVTNIAVTESTITFDVDTAGDYVISWYDNAVHIGLVAAGLSDINTATVTIN